jgi:hypothetical protein
MISRGIKWGVVHDGNTMYVVRIQRKHGRPYIMISSPLSMAAASQPLPLSLICYMLLSGQDDVDVVDPNVVGSVPVPDGSSGKDKYYFQFPKRNDENNDEDRDDNYNFKDNISQISDSALRRVRINFFQYSIVSLILLKTNSLIVNLPALASRVSINMSHNPPLIDALSDLVYLTATSFIGAGKFGRVFKGVLSHPSGHGIGLVIKLAQERCERELQNEANAYKQLGKLAGHVTPAFYGLFTGTYEDYPLSIIVLSYEGHSLTSFNGLTTLTR